MFFCSGGGGHFSSRIIPAQMTYVLLIMLFHLFDNLYGFYGRIVCLHWISIRSVNPPKTFSILHEDLQETLNNLSKKFIRQLYDRLSLPACIKTQWRYTAYQYRGWLMLMHHSLLNVWTYWSLYIILYCNSAILPANLELIETHFQGIAILFSISAFVSIFL